MEVTGVATILTFVCVGVAFAKKRGRKRRRWNPNNAIVRQSVTRALGTLLASDLIGATMVLASDEEYRAISYNGTWTLSGHTAGEGPLHVGVAHGDYSDTEIEEWFESQLAMTRNDMVTREHADRRCRKVGTFSGLGATEVLNDGKPIRTKLNWHITEGGIIRLWIYNQSGATLTTGALVQTDGDLFLRWGQ